MPTPEEIAENVRKAQEAARTPGAKVTATKFYSRFAGTKFCMPDGKLLEFAPVNGESVYETSDSKEIEELNKVVAMSMNVIVKTPVKVKAPEGTVLREVGATTGAQNSRTMGTAATSNSAR